MSRITTLALAGAATIALIATPGAAQSVTPDYPATRATDTSETLFGEAIADPYRWLENDVRTDPQVAQWVEAQNTVTDAYLETLPGTAWFKERLAELIDYERFGIPSKAGDRYFYSYNSGLMNQAQYFVRDGWDGEARLLLDPNQWSADNATALADTAPSKSGRYLAYAIQDGGSDWRTIKLLDVDTGEELSDEIEWAKFTGISWIGDEGFFYSRFPETGEGQDFQSLNYNQKVYFHRLGTPQSADELVYETPDAKEQGHGVGVSDDGRWAFIYSSTGTDDRNELRVIDLTERASQGWAARPLITGFDNSWSPIASVGDTVYFQTNKDAPRYRIVRADLTADALEWEEVVPQSDQPISGASIIGDRLVVEYMKDASSRAVYFDLDGKQTGALDLPGIGSVGGLNGEPGDSETFYSFTSFNQPGAIYRLDVETGERTVFAEPEVAFEPEDYRVEQVFYPSKDGTRVPMFIVRHKDSTGPSPTLLYGYGGFNISLTPGFSPTRLAWLEAGGTFALANIRGGGEYGKEWHDGGRLNNKQNVFDDFIAAGEYLKANGYTGPDGLAIQGGSNGGLLVGAVVNQRPDLFDAGNAAVGVMDMLRFDRWTAGRYWVDDYGYPDREADFRVLRSYSPLHNIRSGVDYPALLVTTADTDDRVVPGHSFKYTAALQAAELGEEPQLIRIETRAGHGSGKPTDKIIDEYGDILAFLAHHTGLEVPPAD
ncbi:prolyl oligopeptidase family serine peptidase [Qipengyuania sp. DY56-A-20]|jgi:prolyl oligopeptidase|uniref:prolyl oligopeptidase n=1 Tax=Qipengyuania benthica TaxID=3067651 RepID=A0ABT9H8S6_9SPHN|nr:prolyl oligopeptidase family serine peptidase [Qipengyuania sp. DY56-A-20]MDP4539722.1 prolyl oligopeptidase family serine peptidase [Qipengyuania sp. DY56-A-20]